MALTNKEIELVYLGVSIASGCKPCTSYHLGKVKEAGASEHEIKNAITVSVNIRDDAKSEMKNYSMNLLGQSSQHEVMEEKLELDRMKILVSIGAAFTVNCTSTLNKYIALREPTTITNKDLNKIFRAAKFVKIKAASHVDKIAMGFEGANADEGSTHKSADCGCEKDNYNVQIKSSNKDVEVKNNCC